MIILLIIYKTTKIKKEQNKGAHLLTKNRFIIYN